jgi:enoyl-CoA hydratase/carnithine racemase
VSGHIHCDKQAGVALVTISAPARMNAMSRHMWLQLAEVFLALQRDSSVRCVLVQGEGTHFCAGGDISEYSSFRFQRERLQTFHEREVWGGLQAMLDCDVPVVARIRGNCMGAGVEMVSCCDIRSAAETSRFGAPIAKLGFPMAPREAALVLREAGALTARQWLLEAAVLDAPTMAQRGFVQHVVPDAELDDHTWRLAQRITQLAPQAARLNKQTLRTLHSLAADRSEAATTALLAQAYDYAASHEHREGIQAFLDKRPPQFVDEHRVSS